MSAPSTVPAPARHEPRRVSPGQLNWLELQLTGWIRDGLIDADTATRIRGSYLARRRFSLMALWITLGSCFVGAGLIWLVAANLDRFSPVGRLALVAAIWIALTVGVEWFAQRRHCEGSAWWVAAESLRLLPAAGYGAVVFQAAQSLQVPAFEPILLLMWALGTLAYAYVVRGPMPLVVGVVLTGIWALWFLLRGVDGEGAGVVITATGVAFLAVAALHRRTRWPLAGIPWRDIGIFGLLIGLFAACIPGTGITEWHPLTLGWLIGSLVLAAAAAIVSSREDRWTLALAAAGTAGTLIFTYWPVIGGFGGTERGNAFITSTLAVLVYLGVATGAAMLGALLDSQRITVLAGIMLALFTTLQAFAVFAPILSGAVLFLSLGVLLILIGWVADRGRRRLFPRERRRGTRVTATTAPQNPQAPHAPEGQ